ncbi:MAG: hypothetical protein DWQ37_20120 [Planctomycetota bacterium]|nr:MAG: hypothetical protein DWQ37_20120 [Planctomycetota bacterium]
MGQYFKAVNLDKREVVCPWCLGGVAKLWEWAAGRHGPVFTLLLRKSSATGGGDYFDPIPSSEREIRIDPTTDEKQTASAVLGAIMLSVAAEGQPIAEDGKSVVGRWAGDRVALVGDYDRSRLWDELPRYRNISKELVEAWNDFIEIDDMKLTFNPNCNCQ